MPRRFAPEGLAALGRVDAREANGIAKAARIERIDRIAIRDAHDFRGELFQLVSCRQRRRGNGNRRDRKLRGFRSREMEDPRTEQRSGDQRARRHSNHPPVSLRRTLPAQPDIERGDDHEHQGCQNGRRPVHRAPRSSLVDRRDYRFTSTRRATAAYWTVRVHNRHRA
jgi:hypothetical protein